MKQRRADRAVKAVLLDQYRVIREARSRYLMHPYDRVDALHDFRVGVRATRSILQQMRRIFSRTRTLSQIDGWAEIAEKTSRVRDIDVMMSALQKFENDLCLEGLFGGFERLLKLLEKEAETAREELATSLSSPVLKKFLKRWDHFLRDHSKRHTRSRWLKKGIREVAGLQILKAHDRLMTAGNAVNDCTPPEALHHLRKLTKKLRYLIASFGGHFSTKKVQSLLKDLKSFQDYLGEYQDCQVLKEKLVALKATHSVACLTEEDLKGISAILERNHQTEMTLRSQFHERWAALGRRASKSRYRSLFAV